MLYFGDHYWVAAGISLLLLLLAEAAFYLYVSRVLYPRISPVRKAPRPALEPARFIERVLHHVVSLKSYDPADFFTGFFLGAKTEDIRSGNMQSFLAWAMYSDSLDNLGAADKVSIGSMVQRISTVTGISFGPGHNPAVEHIQMTLNSISYIHRPLVLYMGSAVKNAAGDMLMYLCGFRSGALGGVTYWVKAAATPSEQAPMLFFHGISTGWIFYFPLIMNLAGSRPVLLVDLDTIKINSLVFDMPEEADFCNAVRDICALHFGADTAVSVVGHSFGTILAAWFLRQQPRLISHLTLLDPVSLLLGLPDVAYNFLHKDPDRFTARVIRLMASREITVSHMLHRHFWWYNNVLWLEDLPPSLSLVIGLSGQDEITNPKLIMEYVKVFQESRWDSKQELTSLTQARTGEITTLYWPNKTHAAVLFDMDAQTGILKAITASESGAREGASNIK